MITLKAKDYSPDHNWSIEIDEETGFMTLCASPIKYVTFTSNGYAANDPYSRIETRINILINNEYYNDLTELLEA